MIIKDFDIGSAPVINAENLYTYADMWNVMNPIEVAELMGPFFATTAAAMKISIMSLTESRADSTFPAWLVWDRVNNKVTMVVPTTVQESKDILLPYWGAATLKYFRERGVPVERTKKWTALNTWAFSVVFRFQISRSDPTNYSLDLNMIQRPAITFFDCMKCLRDADINYKDASGSQTLLPCNMSTLHGRRYIGLHSSNPHHVLWHRTDVSSVINKYVRCR